MGTRLPWWGAVRGFDSLVPEIGVISFDHASNTASKEWLTEVLTANGYLHSGEVVATDQRASRIGATATSTFYEIDIVYSAAANGTAPSSCLMKVGKPRSFAGARKEAAFYDRARWSGRTQGLVTSFATAVDEGAQSAVVLLEDKKDWTQPSQWPLPPNIVLCEAAIRSLATMHARWWNSDELRDPPFQPLILGTNPVEWAKFLTPFYALLGDGLSQSRRKTLEEITDRYPRLVQRRVDQTNAQTLAHGDAHFWNFLFSPDGSAHPILIDWQSFFCSLWRVRSCVHDRLTLVSRTSAAIRANIAPRLSRRTAEARNRVQLRRPLVRLSSSSCRTPALAGRSMPDESARSHLVAPPGSRFLCF